jgi:hypothetical protein
MQAYNAAYLRYNCTKIPYNALKVACIGPFHSCNAALEGELRLSQSCDDVLQANNASLQANNGALQANNRSLQPNNGALQPDCGALQLVLCNHLIG